MEGTADLVPCVRGYCVNTTHVWKGNTLLKKDIVKWSWNNRTKGRYATNAHSFVYMLKRENYIIFLFSGFVSFFNRLWNNYQITLCLESCCTSCRYVCQEEHEHRADGNGNIEAINCHKVGIVNFTMYWEHIQKDSYLWKTKCKVQTFHCSLDRNMVANMN